MTSPSGKPENESKGESTTKQVTSGKSVQGVPCGFPSATVGHHVSRNAMKVRDQEFKEKQQGMRFETTRSAHFYDFASNYRAVHCSITHFQLRNLAWATSEHDVYVMHAASIVHWDEISKRRTQVLNLSGSGHSTASVLGAVQISTMIAKDDLVIAGGFHSEMVAKNMRTDTIMHNKRISYDENAITNAIDMFESTIMTSNNDCCLRCFDVETFERKSQFSFEKAVNHATRQPNGKMVVVAGDENVIQVIDGESGERISLLRGHGHFSYATGWHPSGQMIATGSQDQTCRIWDVRNMSHAVNVLRAHKGPVRSLRFSACGRFMAMAEPRDFIHVFGVNGGDFDTCQEIYFYGEIAGIALTPGVEGLYIAVSDRLYSTLFKYERWRPDFLRARGYAC